MTTQEAAKALYDAFESRTRDNGDTFYCLADDAPEWMTAVVMEAHGTDMLPDDWRYEQIMDAASHIADNGADEDSPHDFADSAVDVYNYDRLKWLASHQGRAAIVDEAVEEMGGDSLDTVERIGLGQYEEASGIYHRLVAALEDQDDVDDAA